MAAKRIKAAFFAAALGLATILAMGQASITRGRNTLSNGATSNGTLTTNTTSACTIADLNETDLWTYSLPANTLNANGRGVRVTAWGTFAANGDVKTSRLYFGGTAMQSAPQISVNADSWQLCAVVIRTGASAELYKSEAQTRSTLSNLATGTLAVDTTAAITIKMTGQNGTAAANDICFKGAIVETIN